MLVQRLRRWPNIKPTFGESLRLLECVPRAVLSHFLYIPSGRCGPGLTEQNGPGHSDPITARGDAARDKARSLHHRDGNGHRDGYQDDQRPHIPGEAAAHHHLGLPQPQQHGDRHAGGQAGTGSDAQSEHQGGALRQPVPHVHGVKPRTYK